VNSKSAISTIEVLTPIWQRLLRRPSIGPEENFFDLGGDSSLALELFNEIAKISGQELPPVMIYQAPTIAALAAVMEEPLVPRLAPLLLMKPGTAWPPVFFAHGLGGSAIDFYQPVKHLRASNPVYGIQSRGLDGLEEPLERIEDMAQFSLEAIREVQPQGPYLLVGFSLGGLLALEMAQRLRESGQEISLLALLDAYPHRSFLSLEQRTRLTTRQAGRRLSSAVRKFQFSGYAEDSELLKPLDGNPLSPVMKRVRESARTALIRYQPRFYKGRMKFVRAAIATEFPDDPAAVWSPMAEKVEVDTVPGDHLGIITTHFEPLADVLSRYIQEAVHKSQI
jgi:acetoacetyl-CoA synthetase